MGLLPEAAVEHGTRPQDGEAVELAKQPHRRQFNLGVYHLYAP